MSVIENNNKRAIMNQNIQNQCSGVTVGQVWRGRGKLNRKTTLRIIHTGPEQYTAEAMPSRQRTSGSVSSLTSNYNLESEPVDTSRVTDPRSIISRDPRQSKTYQVD